MNKLNCGLLILKSFVELSDPDPTMTQELLWYYCTIYYICIYHASALLLDIFENTYDFFIASVIFWNVVLFNTLMYRAVHNY